MENLPGRSQSAARAENLPFDHQKLKNIIAGLENDIASGDWIKTDYAEMDLEVMPALIERANRKYSGLNLKLALTPREFVRLVKENIENGIFSSRFIINIKGGGIHFAVIDHRTIGKNTSLIFFEPTTFKSMTSEMLAIRTQATIKTCQLPNFYFSAAEMDIQRSFSECGMFSLALAKKLHSKAHKLTKMHEDNTSGVLRKLGIPLQSEQLDRYLPASFYKHIQGRERFRKYVKSNPESQHEKVNKRGETLAERFEKNLVTVEGKTVSVSSHRKRIGEYKSLMM
ncbi:YopJ/AvrA family T3SS effector serine/threonine acetyltransferase [Bartonella sp. B39]